MLFIYYIFALLLLVALAWRVGANPLSIYLVPWLFLFINYYLGPIDYLIRVSEFQSTVFLIYYIGIFTLGYLFSFFMVLPNRALANHSYEFDKATGLIVVLGKIGVLGVVLYFFGRMMSGASFLLSGDLSGLRSTFIEDTNFLSRIGALIIGLYFFNISRSLFYGRLYKFSYYPLLLFVLTPLLTAGRQLYLILGLLVVFSLLYLRKFKGGFIAQIKSNGRLFYPVLGLSLSLILIITTSRFNLESQIFFGDKLGMFQSYSSIKLRSDYLFLTFLSQVFYDTVIEFFYYFGAQLARYHELFSALQFDLINSDLLSKVPIVQRNLDKLFGFLGYRSYLHEFYYPDLDIASFTWSTSVIGSLRYGGLFIASLQQFTFAFLFGYAYRRFKINPREYLSFNLVLISSVICVYDIMFPLISDTSVFVYYLASVFLFINSLRR